MRVVVLGATGNVGTSVLESLAGASEVDEIIGVARRLPELKMPKTEWLAADILDADLEKIFTGADCVIHLAWLIQPSHNVKLLDAGNVGGTERVLKAVAAARVPALVAASSIGAYSKGPKDRMVDESWPTEGIRSCYYSRQKAETERLLDRFEADNPSTRVVRLRPSLIFKREAAAGIRRLFVGPLLPNPLARPSLIPVVPDIDGLAIQAVHSRDVGEAYRLAAVGDARGAFNISAEPVLDIDRLAELLGARKVRMRAGVLRAAALASWKLHLQPTDPTWLDMGLGAPLIDPGRARRELGWVPTFTAEQALLELLTGLRSFSGYETPPLTADAGGAGRFSEFRSGVGSRQGA